MPVYFVIKIVKMLHETNSTGFIALLYTYVYYQLATFSLLMTKKSLKEKESMGCPIISFL